MIELAGLLGIDRDALVGKLCRLWIWADQNCIGGLARGVTVSFIDEICRAENMGRYLRQVGWIRLKKNGIFFPNFTRHNGESAKKRANARERQRLSRARRHSSVTKKCDKSVTREEKRREEKRREEEREESPVVPLRDSSNPDLPAGVDDGGVLARPLGTPGELLQAHNHMRDAFVKGRTTDTNIPLLDWKGYVEDVFRLAGCGRDGLADVLTYSATDFVAAYAQFLQRENKAQTFTMTWVRNAKTRRIDGANAVAHKKNKAANARALRDSELVKEAARRMKSADESSENNRMWNKLSVAQKRELMAEDRRQHGVANEQTTKARWCREQKGKSDEEKSDE